MNDLSIDEVARRYQGLFFESKEEKDSLAHRVMENFGEKDGKYQTNVSLASHVFNATLIGLNIFIYDMVKLKGRDFNDIEESDVRLLIASTVLHDLNKFLEHESNTRRSLEEYFQERGDPLGIEDFLGEKPIDEILWLIQRTEVHEDSTESRGTPPANRDLRRYCRIGDAVASCITNKGIAEGKEYLEKEYGMNDEEKVHLAEFTALEQPILNNLALFAAKKQLQEQGSVIIGSTPESVLYMGEEVDLDSDILIDYVKNKISEDFDFVPKAGWNSFDYDILGEIEMPIDAKKKKIADAYAELLKEGKGGIDSHEHISDSFKQYLPYLVKAIYEDKKQKFEDDEIQSIYDSIRNEVGGQKVKIYFLSELASRYKEHKEFLENLSSELEDDLKKDLSPDQSAIDDAVYRFLGKVEHPEAPDKSNCFLCGRPASREYKKSNGAFFNTHSFSRRTPPLRNGDYKKICQVCNLEHELLRHHCKQSGISLTNSIEIVYLYYDDFIPDISFFRSPVSDLIKGEGALDFPEFSTKLLFGPQYHLYPIAIYDKNHRMSTIHRVLKLLQETGMKARIGKPFTRFEAVDDVFLDEEALRQQVVFDTDQISCFSDLNRPLELFGLIEKAGYMCDVNNPYLKPDADTLPALAYFFGLNDKDGKLTHDFTSYLKEYHGGEFMQMKKIARLGLDLFGKQYSSKHKKTKIFRTAIEAFITAMSQGLSEDQVIEYVTGQVYNSAKAEQYSGKVTSEQVNDFIAAIKDYLEENDLYELKKLSDWENALINTYLYAFDNLIYGGEKDDN